MVTNRVIRDTAFAAFKVVLIFSVQASPGHRGILDRGASTQGVQVPGDEWGRFVVKTSQVLIIFFSFAIHELDVFVPPKGVCNDQSKVATPPSSAEQ